ncbi:MAG: hemerythrin domain-containing protein [Aquabacterium sp.]|nr:hemerythrin domain-containing protein [Aquabacterium sp.]
MRHLALDTIHDEHQALAAMLRSMSLMVSQAQRDGHAPDFDVLRSMLFYVDEFPERLHHPKESELLFPRVRERCPELAATLDRLDADHARGEASIRELEHALLAYEVLGFTRQQAFIDALDRYVDGYLHHMAAEETEVLPAAIKHLTPADWSVLDAAFAANRDPLTGFDADDVFKPLFQKIVMTAPAPIGLGN